MWTRETWLCSVLTVFFVVLPSACRRQAAVQWPGAQGTTSRTERELITATEHHDNGQPRITCGYYEDSEGRPVRHGEYTSWHRDGSMWAHGGYRDGKQHGVFTCWNADGTPLARGEWRDGRQQNGAFPRRSGFVDMYMNGKRINVGPRGLPGEGTRERQDQTEAKYAAFLGSLLAVSFEDFASGLEGYFTVGDIADRCTSALVLADEVQDRDIGKVYAFWFRGTRLGHEGDRGVKVLVGSGSESEQGTIRVVRRYLLRR